MVRYQTISVAEQGMWSAQFCLPFSVALEHSHRRFEGCTSYLYALAYHSLPAEIEEEVKYFDSKSWLEPEHPC